MLTDVIKDVVSGVLYFLIWVFVAYVLVKSAIEIYYGRAEANSDQTTSADDASGEPISEPIELINRASF